MQQPEEMQRRRLSIEKRPLSKIMPRASSARYYLSSIGLVTAIVQYADIQVSAKAIQHRWTHEVQIALLRRMAAMTRAVLPLTSATNHWARAPLLDGSEDEDTDTGTDTTVPDDNEDISSFSRQQIATIDVPNL